jgi:hypothetical protein
MTSVYENPASMPLGEWESIETGKRATLCKVRAQCWYEIPEFHGLQPCAIKAWLGSMQPVVS